MSSNSPTSTDDLTSSSSATSSEVSDNSDNPKVPNTSRIYFGYCTFPDEPTAQRICQGLVKDDLVACANICGPVQSIYKWKGSLQKEPEWIAIFKTPESKKSALKEKIRAEHPYENPALVFLEVNDTLPEFLNWVCSLDT